MLRGERQQNTQDMRTFPSPEADIFRSHSSIVRHVALAKILTALSCRYSTQITQTIDLSCLHENTPDDMLRIAFGLH